MKPADFVGLLFLARDVTHSVHLNTRSYAKHKALGKFYESVVGLADDFAEAYQGRHGLIGPISLQSAKRRATSLSFCRTSWPRLRLTATSSAIRKKRRFRTLLTRLFRCI